MHYTRWKRYGDPLYTKLVRVRGMNGSTDQFIECSQEDCSARAQRRGMCNPHYRRQLSTERGQCSIEDCTNIWQARELCPKHYARYSRHQQIYGVDFEALNEVQQGLCAICGNPQKAGHMERLSVDHDHSCCPYGKSCGKCVRGLLCSGCNSGLGYFQDSPELLARAIIYLQKRHLYHAAILMARSRKSQITCALGCEKPTYPSLA